MVAYALRAAVVTVCERGVGAPGVGRLVFQLLAVGIMSLDASLDFCVYGFLYLRGYTAHMWCKLTDVLILVNITCKKRSKSCHSTQPKGFEPTNHLEVDGNERKDCFGSWMAGHCWV